MFLSQGIVKREGDKQMVLSLNPAAQKMASSLLDFAFQLQLPVSLLVHYYNLRCNIVCGMANAALVQWTRVH